MIVPLVIDKSTPHVERSLDLWSYLLKHRIVYLSGHIEPEVADIIVGQLLFLESQDRHSDIFLYINSPGGNVLAGLGIYDVMNYIKPDVSTVCLSQAASMGAVLLSSGTPGKRFSFPSAEIMIHKASAGFYGKEPDIEISANRIIELNKNLVNILAKNTGRPLRELMRDTDRDNFMNPQEALQYGLIDEIIKPN